MNRRKFNRQLGFISASTFVLPIACNQSVQEVKVAFDVEEKGLTEIRQAIDNEDITIVDLVQSYLDRIAAIDTSGPTLNSIIHVNTNTLTVAKRLDQELKEGKNRGPLHGIPVILKDNIDTADMPTTAGSRALEESIPPDDARVAKQLRAAGAIILAKANLSEWANFRGEDSTSGWSGLGGLTKNPYKLDRNTCGSSAGSGAAVAASLCVFALGTETNGSIVCPSSTNGVVGIKPTVGLVSRDGIIPISSTQDTAGPMARTVTDAAIALGVLSESNLRAVVPGDKHPNEINGSIDYTSSLKKDALKGKKIAYYNKEAAYQESDSKDQVDPVFALMASARILMESQGAEIVDVTKLAEDHVFEDSFEIMLYEYKQGLNDYFASLGADAPVKTIDELIEWNRTDSIELQHFGQEYLEMAAAKGGLDDKAYKTAKDRMLSGRRELGLDKVMDELNLDAIMAPTGSPAWKTDLENGDSFHYGSSSPAAQAGYPNVCVPMGYVDGLPVGLSIFGRAYSEGLLISIAYAYEQATMHRVPPQYLPS